MLDHCSEGGEGIVITPTYKSITQDKANEVLALLEAWSIPNEQQLAIIRMAKQMIIDINREKAITEIRDKTRY